MSVQNPIIPNPTDPKGIDSVVFDLQTHLNFSLAWLTNGLGRAYRMAKVEVNKSTFYLPQIYLGTAKSSYFSGTPDNDKQAQNFFYVGDGVLTDPQNVGYYGYMEYPISIIFSANLKLIDSTLLETEDFTEHLISDVRQALIRDLIGKSYRLRVDNIQREFDDVFSEFDITNNRGIDLLPLTHFRFNCTLLMREVCNESGLTRCAAILQNLTTDDLLNCILPTYDFASGAVQGALTAQQDTDLTAYLLPLADCNELTTYLTATQKNECILPTYDFSDGAVNSELTAQQKEDLKPVIVPELDYQIGDDTDFNLFDAQQLTDLQTRLCVAGSARASFDFDGVSEYFNSIYNAAHEIERTDMFTLFAWVKIDTLAVSWICSKYDQNIPRTGYYLRLLADGRPNFILTNDNVNNIIRIEATNPIALNTWTLIAVRSDGSGTAAGLEMFVNGAIAASTKSGVLSSTTVSPTKNFKIAGNVAGGFYNGKIALVGLYKGVALSDAEMLQLMTLPYPKDSLYPANQIIWADAGSALWYNNFWLIENKADTVEQNSFQSVLMEYADRDKLDYPT